MGRQFRASSPACAGEHSNRSRVQRTSAAAVVRSAAATSWAGRRPTASRRRVSGSRMCGTSSSGWIQIRRAGPGEARPIRSVSTYTRLMPGSWAPASPSGTDHVASSAGTASTAARTCWAWMSSLRSAGAATRRSSVTPCPRASATRRARPAVEQMPGTASRQGLRLTAAASFSSTSAVCTSCLAAGSMSRPKGVRTARRDVRSNSCSPKRSSRAATRRLATDWDIRASAAPTVKLPCSLTLTNARHAPTRSTVRTLCQIGMEQRMNVLDRMAARR